MLLFKPIWESKNRRKLEDFISKTHDGGALVKIALESCVPEARDAALRMLIASHPTHRMYYNEELMARFVLKGAYTAWALDFIMSKDLLEGLGAQLPDSKSETILKCALRSGNRDLLARSALLTKQLGDWNEAFDLLLSDPAYAQEVKAHLEALKKKDRAEHSAAEKTGAGRQAEAEQRQQKKEARKDDPLREALKYLRAARDKEDAEARWRAYYTRQLSSDRNTLLTDLSHRLDSLSWTNFFPSGAAARLCDCSLSVRDDQGWLMTESEIRRKAESELNLVLSKLYEARSDLRAEIIALDGTLFSEASGEAGAYDYQGDPGEHRIETTGFVPRLIIHVVPDGKTVRIMLERG